MTLDPLLTSAPLIQFHTIAALIAFVLGPVAILRRRRDRLHRVIGYSWVTAMAVAAATALGISELRMIGPVSPIHGLSLLVGVVLWRGLRAIRAGRVVDHGRMMAQLYIWSMGVAGLFTLLPGRRMHLVLLDGTGWAGFGAAACLFGLGALLLWRAQPVQQGQDHPHFPLFNDKASR